MPHLELEYEIEHLDRLIKAAEDWSKQYKRDKKSYAELIKNEARLERVLRTYFRELAQRVHTFIDWNAYNATVKAYNVKVLIIDELLEREDQSTLEVLLDPIVKNVALGAIAGERIYNKPI